MFSSSLFSSSPTSSSADGSPRSPAKGSPTSSPQAASAVNLSSRLQGVYDDFFRDAKMKRVMASADKQRRMAEHERVAGLHRRWLLGQPGTVMNARRALRGRRLGCWCAAGLACHAYTLVVLANCSEERLWAEVVAAGAAAEWQAWAAAPASAAVASEMAERVRASKRG